MRFATSQGINQNEGAPRFSANFVGVQRFENTERFQILRVLGEGSHGVVYAALDMETREVVALKTLRTISPDSLFAFKQEFRSIQHLTHPNLVELFDFGNAQGTWYFTMRLVDGVGLLEYVRPLGERLAPAPTTERLPIVENLSAPGQLNDVPSRTMGGTLNVTRLRASLAQVASGLMALHASGKVHRDIKPNNMLVTANGRVVILDFGLAAEVHDFGKPRQQEEIAGTVAYMSPEQAAGRAITHAADWYALGVVLFEALTGRLPFFGTAMGVLVEKQQRAAPDPRSIEPLLPADLSELAKALLRVDPAERPSGAEILRRLELSAA